MCWDGGGGLEWDAFCANLLAGLTEKTDSCRRHYSRQSPTGYFLCTDRTLQSTETNTSFSFSFSVPLMENREEKKTCHKAMGPGDGELIAMSNRLEEGIPVWALSFACLG